MHRPFFLCLLVLFLSSSCFFEFDRQVVGGEATIVGRVVDDAGNELEGVRVVVLGTALSGASNTDGRFSQTAPRGEVFLRFEADLNDDGVFERAALRALRLLDEEVDVGDVTLEATVEISGRVEDDAGARVASASVEVHREFDVEGQTLLGPAEVNVSSANDGTFIITGVVPGNIRLEAAQGEVRSEVLEALAPSENNLLILPAPEGCVRFANTLQGNALDVLEGVECVAGSLRLENVDDLSFLSSLRTVGSLSISGGTLRDLGSLRGLEVIESDLLLSDLVELTSLDPFEGTRFGNGTRAGNFALIRSGIIGSFEQPEMPATIASLTLDGNNQLIRARAFEFLTRIDNELTIANNTALLGLDLEALESVGGSITIEGNSADVQSESEALIARVQP